MDNEPLLTIRQLGVRWCCCKMTINRMMRRGDIPYMKFGKSVRFDLKDVRQFEARTRVGGSTPPATRHGNCLRVP